MARWLLVSTHYTTSVAKVAGGAGTKITRVKRGTTPAKNKISKSSRPRKKECINNVGALIFQGMSREQCPGSFVSNKLV